MSYQISRPNKPTPAEREAQKVFKVADGKVPLSDYERAQQVFHANRKRLKAERLAREAVAPGKFKT